MKKYLELVQYVLDNGEKKKNRTGIDTLSVFGYQSIYNLQNGFPLLTTKQVNFDAIKAELLWFIKGSTNINDLKAIYPTKIWDDWADKDGELGPIYGKQWRCWQYNKIIKKFPLEVVDENNANVYSGVFEIVAIDQLTRAINDIKFNPDSRRIIVSAWNVAQLEDMKMYPCHSFIHFNVSNGFIDLQLYQRSADIALGVPFNIASYSLLLMMIAKECILTPRNFIHTLGDAHIYVNHIEGLQEQLKRNDYVLPGVIIQDKPFYDITFDDIMLVDYHYHPKIHFPIAV